MLRVKKRFRSNRNETSDDRHDLIPVRNALGVNFAVVKRGLVFVSGRLGTGAPEGRLALLMLLLADVGRSSRRKKEATLNTQ